jgi:hypothetical protein
MRPGEDVFTYYPTPQHTHPHSVFVLMNLVVPPLSQCFGGIERNTMSAVGFTAIELLLFLCCIAFGTVAALALRVYGWIGLVIGFVGGFALVPVTIYLVLLTVSFVWTGKPPLPACQCGNSERGHYKFVRLEDGDFGHVCDCGLRYRKKGGRVWEILPNGTAKPYMKWRALRGWYPDSQ